MKLRRMGAAQVAELLIGVVPTAIFVGPELGILIAGLVLETLPGILRGASFRGQWGEAASVLLGPIGVLALISLCLLILFGPEGMARRRSLRIMAVGSGIPGLVAALWVIVSDVRLLAMGLDWSGAGLRFLWAGGWRFYEALSLTGSTLVGLKYLRFLPLMLHGRDSAEAPGA